MLPEQPALRVPLAIPALPGLRVPQGLLERQAIPVLLELRVP